MSKMYYDFDDGNGLVPAHQHVNSNGELGGWVANTAYVEPTVYVGKNARIYNDAMVLDNVQIYHNAKVCGSAEISNNAEIYGNASISGNAKIYSCAEIYGNAEVFGNAKIFNCAEIFGNAKVYDNAKISENAKISGYAEISSNAVICNEAIINNTDEYLCIGPIGSRNDYTTFTRYLTIHVTTGCFYGTLEEFMDRVKRTHKNNNHAKEYMQIVDSIKIKWG